MGLINLEAISQDDGYPPVHQWKPEFCGDMDLLIQRNGEWIHEGSAIKREKMVTLFSRVLWCEDSQYFLVTPHEKVRIQVEDVPFLVTQCECKVDDNGRTFFAMQTTTKDQLQLGIDTELELHDWQGELLPYITMRYGMKASLHRNVFYDLANNYAEEQIEGDEVSWWIESAGKRYCIGRS
ncbi:DUF1285 domain-containing protein [Marinomonas balearica]|uniref:DUF1285 domain-containing protein n=1 Tax=Marinomonas balearica TaxID=491947 RepID=A0A4V3CGS8_9GAMM|nr:DUF1285 domain-containing protein [Marinomonas balearica]TDO98892.1 hypothetical protein DFP79_1307 [Marinomonas balearica]